MASLEYSPAALAQVRDLRSIPTFSEALQALEWVLTNHPQDGERVPDSQAPEYIYRQRRGPGRPWIRAAYEYDGRTVLIVGVSAGTR